MQKGWNAYSIAIPNKVIEMEGKERLNKTLSYISCNESFFHH
jgi:hypothetical protein